uniref:Uncharacterized protein n=1 Tax=Amphimedon queenslandica TaxID=400682 RepID=A0A1X7TPP5_AMPQE
MSLEMKGENEVAHTDSENDNKEKDCDVAKQNTEDATVGEEAVGEDGMEVELSSQEMRNFFQIPLSPLPEPVSAEAARDTRLAKVKLLKEKYRLDS